MRHNLHASPIESADASLIMSKSGAGSDEVMSAKRLSIRLSTIENLVNVQSTIDPGSQVTRTRNSPKTFFGD
jgi:hypothetical protein